MDNFSFLNQILEMDDLDGSENSYATIGTEIYEKYFKILLINFHDLLISTRTSELLDEIILFKENINQGESYEKSSRNTLIQYLKNEMKNKLHDDYTFEYFMEDIKCSLDYLKNNLIFEKF